MAAPRPPHLIPLPGGKASPTAIADDELMRLAADDQMEAFAEVVRRHEPRIRAYCAKYLGDAAAGDDVAQEVFLEAWRARSRYRPTGQLGGYLATIARNRCASHKRRQREQACEFVDAIAAPPPEGEDPHRAERLARVDRAVARISPKLREALLLRFSADLDYPDIARITGRSAVTVRSRVFLALRRLRELLDGGSQ